MQLNFEHQSKRYQCATEVAVSIAIELDFDGRQPSCFGVEPASATALKQDGFVGDTRQGGSCNVQALCFVPHCNGTHTETVGHIVNEEVPVAEVVISPIMVAMLVTVQPKTGTQAAENYRPKIGDADEVIDSKVLLEAVSKVGDPEQIRPEALIVRTLPNDADKRRRNYAEGNTPFFTIEAIKAINAIGVEHLLVDLPSIDRTKDDGLLTNHHLFWNVPERTHALTESTLRNKTITEMIYVDDSIADGIFGLNIQASPFISDAGPSRPVVMRLKPAK